MQRWEVIQVPTGWYQLAWLECTRKVETMVIDGLKRFADYEEARRAADTRNREKMPRPA